MNILAHDSEISRLNEIEKLVSKFDKKPALFKISSKTCDAEFISFWLSTSDMDYTSKDLNFEYNVYPHICEELKRDPEINIALIKISPSIFLNNIDPKLVSNYDELARTAVKVDEDVFKNIDPKLVSNYDELALAAVSWSSWYLRHVKPEHLNNYDELVKIAMDNDIEYVRGASTSGVYNLEKTKRRDLLNYIKSSQCSHHQWFAFRNCKYNQEQTAAVNQWLKDYDEYEKEQEVN